MDGTGVGHSVSRLQHGVEIVGFSHAIRVDEVCTAYSEGAESTAGAVLVVGAGRA